MNQAKRAREIEQFFITITRASAALEATLKREFGLSLGEYRVLDEVASAGKLESAWENLPSRSFLALRV